MHGREVSRPNYKFSSTALMHVFSYMTIKKKKFLTPFAWPGTTVQSTASLVQSCMKRQEMITNYKTQEVADTSSTASILVHGSK